MLLPKLRGAGMDLERVRRQAVGLRCPLQRLVRRSRTAHQSHSPQRSGADFLELKWLESDPDVPDGKWFKRFKNGFLAGNG